jgi:hypothetical protein
MFNKYVDKFNKSDTTFDKDWMIANKLFSDYNTAINDAKLKESILTARKEVRNGLNTKFERVMILQNQIDKCLDNLTNMKCDDIYFVDGVPTSYKRNMNQREMNDTRKTLNTLQIEISKIEGDYAPIKKETDLILSTFNIKDVVTFSE